MPPSSVMQTTASINLVEEAPCPPSLGDDFQAYPSPATGSIFLKIKTYFPLLPVEAISARPILSGHKEKLITMFLQEFRSCSRSVVMPVLPYNLYFIFFQKRNVVPSFFPCWSCLTCFAVAVTSESSCLC